MYLAFIASRDVMDFKPGHLYASSVILGVVSVLLSSRRVASTREGGALCSSSGVSRLIDSRDSSLDVRCRQLLDAYSKRAESFVSCMLTSAKPVCFCEMCKGQYNHVRQAYRNITGDASDGGWSDPVDCRTLLLQSDRIQAVDRTRTFIYDLWQDSSCQECYKNGSLSEDTITFYTYLNNTKQCFGHFLTDLIPLQNSTPIDSGTSFLLTTSWLQYILPRSAALQEEKNVTACTACADEYNQLKSFYNYLRDRGTVCADLVDHMNITRTEWARLLHCSDYHIQEEESLIIGAMVFLVFVSFYVLNYFHYVMSNKPVVETVTVEYRRQRDLPNGTGQQADRCAETQN